MCENNIYVPSCYAKDYKIELIKEEIDQLFKHLEIMYESSYKNNKNSYLISGIVINDTDYKYMVSKNSIIVDYCYGSCGPQRLMIKINDICNENGSYDITIILLSEMYVNTKGYYRHILYREPIKLPTISPYDNIIRYSAIISDKLHDDKYIKDNLFKIVFQKMSESKLFNDNIYLTPNDRTTMCLDKHGILLDKYFSTYNENCWPICNTYKCVPKLKTDI